MRNHGLVWLKQHLGEACELLRLYREVAEIKNVTFESRVCRTCMHGSETVEYQTFVVETVTEIRSRSERRRGVRARRARRRQRVSGTRLSSLKQHKRLSHVNEARAEADADACGH